jgi:hypothetical protein
VAHAIAEGRRSRSAIFFVVVHNALSHVRFQREADIDPQAKLAGSVENDPELTSNDVRSHAAFADCIMPARGARAEDGSRRPSVSCLK